MSDKGEYRLDRIFKAPRSVVWRTWTDPELLARWYGPGVETIIHRFDLKPGGAWLNEMRWGEVADFSRMDFQEVTPENRLVWHHSSADANWNIVSNARMPDWPKTLLTTVTFTDEGGETNVCLTQLPMNASEAEVACFTQMMAGMSKGWGSGYAIIDEMLAELQAEG
ncbi:MAG: SRPBCC domain-containing protein [Alphaproteobacteria bacterium]|nr:SRPBCC domain-containing protein [Alphaproteobacteria bacterium]